MFLIPNQMLAGSMMTSAMMAEMSARTMSSVTRGWADSLRRTPAAEPMPDAPARIAAMPDAPADAPAFDTQDHPTREHDTLAGPVGPLPG